MLRAMDQWLGGYLLSLVRRPRPSGTKHLLFCVADHFEPLRDGTAPGVAQRDIRAWVDAYRQATAGFRDADGVSPRHTFFYPAEQYDVGCVEALGELCAVGGGEVEVHLHHRGDTPAGLERTLTQFRDILRTRHGLLGNDAAGNVRFGFVHGNWALCNSRPDRDWCGVDEELTILRRSGCYADFTFPSAPSPTQPRMVNAIYYAADRPGRAGGHKRGRRVVAGRGSGGQDTPGSLLLITGPLGLDWRSRKWGIVPRIENSEIHARHPVRRDRIRSWARQGIHVEGRDSWIFVKVHTHGFVPGNREALLGEGVQALHGCLQEEFNDGTQWRLHYVSAREMYNLVRAAEQGEGGDPGRWRDLGIAPPPGRRS